MQNDIIGILDSNYNQIVTYEYDSWGNIISITDSIDNPITNSSNIGLINPFRYRSYYYDEETKLYYLNNRYYNPKWRRFINIDGILGSNSDMLSYNLYLYASNNPVTFCDYDGLKRLFSIISPFIPGPTSLSLETNKAIGKVSSLAEGITKFC